MSQTSPVASPCISVCFLDEHDICVGCHRTIDEVARWWEMSDAERREVLARSVERRKASGSLL